MKLGKYLGYGSSIKAYLWIDDVTLEDDLSLNLYIMPTIYHIVIILDGQEGVIREFLSWVRFLVRV